MAELTQDATHAGQQQKKNKSKIREYTEALLSAAALAFLIRTFIIQSFVIPSGSMENTLLVGDFLLANKFIYGVTIPGITHKLFSLRTPRRGEVVIFKYPLDPSQEYIKRVVGLPGDEITIRDKQVYVNGTLSINPHEIHTDTQIRPISLDIRDNFGPIKVPEHSYFVMGDNRDNSYDSRFWGYVPDTGIVGLAMIKFWSWDTKTWSPRFNRIGRRIE